MTIDEQHFARVDLNLMIVFLVIYREMSISRAARHLALGQPAVSASLVRLRKCFDDPLFIRKARGVAPTPKAQRIATDLLPAMSKIQALLILLAAN
ncbi:LysR family transcriptional regulator [Pseudomonas abieticivorans]|uniref:LysR family transcriptional regulator n=1 Tax=Pseudomonas abieticivorans TaxID=2931382 RepID=UPI0020BDB8E0|nr:LysR family transcriptional regulator [Pseudomonas sp. PIA16]